MKTLLTAAAVMALGLSASAFAQTATPTTQPAAQPSTTTTQPAAQPTTVAPKTTAQPATTAAPVAKVAQQDCAGLWRTADANKDASLTDKELDKLKGVMAAIDGNKDGKISQTEFTDACQKGTLKDIKL